MTPAIVYNRDWSYAPPPTHYEPGGADLIYADEDILIVNKPAGLLSVPGKAAHMADCLQMRVREPFNYARIVHRLDMETSGVMVMARHHKAHKILGHQFESRQVSKSYIADVTGEVKDDCGEISAPLRCDWDRRPLQIIDHVQGKKAVTNWEVMTRGKAFSRLRLIPVTGRSHQLRVHLLSIGHPIIGDRLYAPDDAFDAAPRMHLHAHTLTLCHPGTGIVMQFEAPCPFDWPE